VAAVVVAASVASSCVALSKPLPYLCNLNEDSHSEHRVLSETFIVVASAVSKK
jgi:hypothetical protein